MLARPPSGERNPGGTAIQHASALTDFTAQGDLGRARDNYMEKHVYTLYWLVCACNVSSATVQDILLRLYTDGLSTAEAYILCEQMTSTAAAAAIKRLPVGDGDRLAELHDLWLVPYRSVHVQWLLRCFWNLAPEHLRDKNLMNGLLISRRGRHSPIPPAMSTALRHLYEHIRGAPEPIKQKGWRHFAERPAHAVPRALADESTARADDAPCRPDGRPTADAADDADHDDDGDRTGTAPAAPAASQAKASKRRRGGGGGGSRRAGQSTRPPGHDAPTTGPQGDASGTVPSTDAGRSSGARSAGSR